MPQKRSNLIWWILGISIVIGLPFLLYLLIGGIVEGEEFSPDDFSRRYFSYNIMPIFGTYIQGIEYHDKTPVFEQTLLADGFLGRTTAAPELGKQWHLIYDNASDAESRDFDAKLLIRFLDLIDIENHESIWDKWNEKYPELAKDFWPIVAAMAKSYLYVELTEIMVQAKSLDESRLDEFERFMVKHASSAFADHGDQLQDQGKFEQALKSYEKSYELQTNEQAARGKSRCLEKMGEIPSSADDGISAESEDQ